jgi:hypothetical protein
VSGRHVVLLPKAVGTRVNEAKVLPSTQGRKAPGAKETVTPIWPRDAQLVACRVARRNAEQVAYGDGDHGSALHGRRPRHVPERRESIRASGRGAARDAGSQYGASGHRHSIQARLVAAVQWTGLAHVVGPGVVVRAPNTQLQPDVLVFPATYKPDTDWRRIKGHWLAIEVLSGSSKIYDREFKKDAYFALGGQ